MTLTCAVVGGGDASSAHLSALAKHPDVDLCAVCDADESRAGDRASTYDIRAYGDFEGMLALESLDWIHLCTPTGVHFEQARMALEDDLAIHVESPLTDRAANAEELARLVEGRGGSVSVTSDGVFTPTIQRVATLIEEGAVGTVRAIDIQHTGVAWPHEIGDRDWLGRLDGGAFEAGLASPISQVAYLGGHPSSPSAITANSSRHGTSEDRFDFDTATFQYTTDEGICCSGTVIASDVSRRILRVHGDRGTIVADSRSGSVSVDDGSDRRSLGSTARKALDRLSSKLGGRNDADLTSNWDGIDEETPIRTPLEAQIAAEATALLRGDPLPVPLDTGVWTVHVIEAIRTAGQERHAQGTTAPVIDAT